MPTRARVFRCSCDSWDLPSRGKGAADLREGYSEAGTRLLWILALSALPLVVNYLYFSVRRVQQRMAGVVASAVWVLIVTLGLSVALLPRIGLVGAGVAWFAAQTSLAAVILVRFAANRWSLCGNQRKAGRKKMPVKAEGLRDARLPHGRKANRVSVREVMIAVLLQEGPGVGFEICVGVDQG